MKQVGLAGTLMALLVGGTYLLAWQIGDSTWFNTLRHILFGMIAAWGTKAVFRWADPAWFDRSPVWLHWLMAVGGFAFLAVVWEIYEFRAGTVRANPFVLDPYNDTVWDMEHGLIGAVAGMLIPVWKEEGAKKQERSP